YTVVDMCAEDGMGDVISAIGEPAKNILLLDTVEEKVAAVRHSNGTDYWVVTHKLYSDAYHAFLLTSSGITDHVITHAGALHDGFQGQLKFSPFGDHIACASALNWGGAHFLEYSDFDRSNGTISNVRSLNAPNEGGIHGTEFSPDGSK